MIETRRGLGLGGFLVLVSIVLLVVAAAGIFPIRRLVAQERSVDLAQAKLDALVEENLRLEQQISALDTDAEIERLAREQFGLVKPGEVGYLAVVPDGIVDPVPPGRDLTLERARPWWVKLWNFVSGRDITQDG